MWPERGLRPLEIGSRSQAKDAVWQFFVESVRENLHIVNVSDNNDHLVRLSCTQVLTMSPVGSALRSGLKKLCERLAQGPHADVPCARELLHHRLVPSVA